MKKTAVITGADGGMGSEITRAVAEAGYRVIMICRDSDSGNKRKEEIINTTGNIDIEVIETNLSSLSSIMKSTDIIRNNVKSIDLLMNNAGTMATHYHTTADGLEDTVAVNYVAPYLLTRRLLPIMHKGTRIVNMVSCTYAIGKIGPNFFTRGTEGSFWRIPIYSNTKFALWLFTRKLSLLLEERGITVNASDPGIVSTNIIRMHMWFDPLTDIFFRPFIRKPRKGADTAIRLLLNSEYDNCSGDMYASGKKRNLKPQYLNHPQMDALWNDTENMLKRKGIEL